MFLTNANNFLWFSKVEMILEGSVGELSVWKSYVQSEPGCILRILSLLLCFLSLLWHFHLLKSRHVDEIVVWDFSLQDNLQH